MFEFNKKTKTFITLTLKPSNIVLLYKMVTESAAAPSTSCKPLNIPIIKGRYICLVNHEVFLFFIALKTNYFPAALTSHGISILPVEDAQYQML